eukprot:SAG11_NODE_27439_length_332_cov_2.077253_1_plen_44_part_01
MIPVCEVFFRTALGYKRDDRQWRAGLNRAKKQAHLRNQAASAAA